MASNINITKPTDVNATTKSIRDNFVTVKTEIEDLQSTKLQLSTAQAARPDITGVVASTESGQIVLPDGSFNTIALLNDLSNGQATFSMNPGTSTSTRNILANNKFSADIQYCSYDDFNALAVPFANYDTVNPITISAKVAVTATDAAVQNTLTFTNLTFAGAASVTLPAATVGAGGQTIPSFAISDRVVVKAAAAVGSVRYVRVVETIQSSSSQRSLVVHLDWLAALNGINGDARLKGMLIKGLFNENADWYAASTNITPVVAGLAHVSCGVLTYHAINSYFGVCFGDSRDQGQGSTGDNVGWPQLFNANSTKGSILSFGTGGQRTVDSVAAMKSFLTRYKPSFVTMTIWSPNDGYTDASVDAAFGAILDAIDYCRQLNVTFILRASFPAGLEPSTKQMQYFNALNNGRYLYKIDMYTPMQDGTGRLISAYNSGDNVHLSNAGYLFASQLFDAALPSLLI